MYEIEFYGDSSGKNEVYEYIQKLHLDTTKESRLKLKKIYVYFELLSEHGLNLNMPYMRKLTKNIWELRPLSDRILFATWHNNKFVILSVFCKQSQKTPRYEIERAERYFKDFKERSGANE